MRASERAEDGLIGRTVLVALVLLLALGLAAADAVAILTTTYRAADLASQAAYEASREYARAGDPRAACQAAEELVRAREPTARIPRAGCVLDLRAREVTITVRKTAPTLLVRRLPALRHLARVRATDTLALPG